MRASISKPRDPPINAPAIKNGAEFIGPPAIFRNNLICPTTSPQTLKTCIAKVTAESQSLYPDAFPSLTAFPDKWVLVSMLDDTADSRSQVVMLQSAQKQFAANHLQVVHFDGSNDALGGLTTLLVSPNRRVVRRWKGFVGPAELGLALREYLGEPNYAHMGPS